jgi:hypothetical protein
VGRQTKLEYDVQPIVLARFALTAKVDLPHWADALGLNVGYATNRVYKSGGDIGNTSLANQLGVNGALSDALDAVLTIAGIKATGRIAHFNHGTARDILIADGSTIAEAPLTFDVKQLDLAYDLAPRRGSGNALQSFTIGARYFDYSLPRVLYETVNSTPGASTASYVFSRESPPQAVRTRLYMLDIATRIEKRLTPHFTPYASVDFAIGYGPTDYYFLHDPNLADVPSNQDQSSTSAVGIGVAGALGLRWFVGGPESRFNGYFDASYHAQWLSSALGSTSGGDTHVDSGSSDLFHGPRAALGLTF